MIIRPPKPMAKISSVFTEAFASNCAGCYRTCSCGRVHFDGAGDWDWNEGELEDLRARSDKDPDRYREHDHAIGTYNIDRVEYVFDCPCQGGIEIEHFIIRNQHAIANFLNDRKKYLIEQANQAPTVNLSNDPP